MSMKTKVLLFAMLLIFAACGKKTNVKGVVASKYIEPKLFDNCSSIILLQNEKL